MKRRHHLVDIVVDQRILNFISEKESVNTPILSRLKSLRTYSNYGNLEHSEKHTDSIK
jgi:hypothetical protein